MAGKRDGKGGKGSVIIKKYEIVASGHHGGAWKVAYADFVTAMMAFFLLMWLLNATTEDQRKGLADYFSPNNLLSESSSGTGQPFGGHTAFDEGALVSDRGAVHITVGKQPVIKRKADGKDPVFTEYHHAMNGTGVGQGPLTQDQDTDDEVSGKFRGYKATIPAPGPGGGAVAGQQGQPAGGTAMKPALPSMTPAQLTRNTLVAAARASAEEAARSKAKAEGAAFQRAAQQIREAVQSDPALAGVARQLAVDITPQGLRIQIIDEVKMPMFASGSAVPNDRVKLLLQKLIPVLRTLPEPISIAGHTDSAPYPGTGMTNWELSADRADATRRLLEADGLPDSRVRSVVGYADRDPLLPADPLAAANRRIAILVMRQATPPAKPTQP